MTYKSFGSFRGRGSSEFVINVFYRSAFLFLPLSWILSLCQLYLNLFFQRASIDSYCSLLRNDSIVIESIYCFHYLIKYVRLKKPSYDYLHRHLRFFLRIPVSFEGSVYLYNIRSRALKRIKKWCCISFPKIKWFYGRRFSSHIRYRHDSADNISASIVDAMPVWWIG